MKPTCFCKAQTLMKIIFKHVWFRLTLNIKIIYR